ncbi:hypothetical protein PuT2_14685 [Pusillimonas sp. T2]|uniref:hypothetical protein n=1 Tax=Pusillimonas sp. T2 TaxID=1548123 RepID=UPI000B8AF35D|nr:hypothetical protein [Pusillimonas sp. T2]OXR48041.1 hypothetical protein PuT2_14685 [Pusillimonas sp. T2]
MEAFIKILIYLATISVSTLIGLVVLFYALLGAHRLRARFIRWRIARIQAKEKGKKTSYRWDV